MKEIRKNAAALARDIRALFPTLQGNWTRREWNDQARLTAHRYISNMVRFHRVNSK